MSVILRPTDQIKARLGLAPNGRVQKYFTYACYKAMDKYVPMDKGDLRTNVLIEDDVVIYQSPYARYQYYGMRNDKTHKVKHYTTPGTGRYWDRRMWTAEQDQILNELQAYVRR